MTHSFPTRRSSDLRDLPARRAFHLLARLGIERRPEPDAHRDRDAARAVEIEEVEALDERRGAALIAGEAVGDHEESTSPPGATLSHSSGLIASITQIGRASGRERVCQYV